MPEFSKLLHALDFAATRHRDQRRKGKTAAPYINHLIEVANLLSSVGKVNDVEVLMAAVLHDVLEDTKTSAAEIEELFGKRVCKLVESVTDDKTQSKQNRKQQQVERVARAGFETRIIKLADHCSNIASLPESWNPERKREYLDWSAAVIKHCKNINPALESVYQERAERSRKYSGNYSV